MTESTISFMFFVIVASGVVLIAMSLRNRQRMYELAMRERIALIEKGLVPPPEVDPAFFDTFNRRADRLERLMHLRRSVGPAGGRYRSFGIMMIGFGLALMMLLTFAAGTPGTALGVGGAFVIVGGAMFINGVMLGHTGEPAPSAPPRVPSVAPHAQDPSANVGP